MIKLRKSKAALKVMIPLAVVVIAVGLYTASYYNLLPQKSYAAEDFNIETLQSGTDFNGNGVDDYNDILLGARADAENHPAYKSAYYDGGYPPENIGVCTDVVWRAFKNAGYCLREMVNPTSSIMAVSVTERKII